MTTISVNVTFAGTVDIQVPDGLTAEQQQTLAKKFALSRILATTENPDAPDEDACYDFAVESGLSDVDAVIYWDDTTAEGVGGVWNTP